MLHSRTMNNKINRLHERSLSIIQSDQSSTFEKLLERDGTFSIQLRNIQSLAIEIYKFVNDLSSEIMNIVFHLKENNRYSLRNVYEFYSRNPRIVKYGTETISYLAPKMCSMVPQTIKESTSIYSFKTKTKKKEMETRLPMPAFQKIFKTCWFCVKVIFISLINLPYKEVFSEPSQTSRMELSP